MTTSLLAKRVPAATPPGQRLGRALLSVVDGGLAAVVCVAPWFFGGRHPVGELVFVGLSAVITLAWLARQLVAEPACAWRRTPADYVILAGLALLLLQLTPLPDALLNLLSPQIAKILPLWSVGSSSPAQLGSWTQATLTPEATRAALALFLAYGCLFLVTVQRIEHVSDVERLLRWVAVSAVILAGVGIAQYLAGNGKFLWVYQHPYRRADDAVKGPFVNQNHFAHMLALALGPLVWAIQRALRGPAEAKSGFSSTAEGPEQRSPAPMAWLGALGLVLFAGLMTLSRGGAAAMFVAALVSVTALYRAELVNKRFVLSLAGVFLLIGCSLAIHGYQRVAGRLDDLTTGSIDRLDREGYRRRLWEADLRAVADFPRLGTGAGSHAEVYPLYLDEPWDRELTHAECGYLQVAMETGVAGLLLLFGGIGLCGYWCLTLLRAKHSRRLFACAAAVAAALAASAVHSLGDFVWYIPACMATTVIMAACACRLVQLARAERGEAPKQFVVSRRALAVATVLVAVGGVWLTGGRIRAAMAGLCWDDYLRYVHAPEVRAGNVVPNQAAIDNLEELLSWAPSHARAQLRLATAYCERFAAEQQTAENAFSINQIRDAAMASRFASRAALDRWLDTAIGPRHKQLDAAAHHARRAAALCPLQGEAYALLAELCFLDGKGARAKSDYVMQAVLVRPNDGEVLVAAGNEAALAGQRDQAKAYWQKALRVGPKAQKLLVGQLAASGTPSAEVLGSLEVDLPAARQMHAAYSRIESGEQIAPLLRHYATLLAVEASDAEDARLWLELEDVRRQLGDLAGRIASLRRALAVDSNCYDARFLLGMCLLEAGQLAEAEQQVRWCIERRPDDANLRAKLAEVVKGKLEGTDRAATLPRGGTR